jgi:hypothetical protein
VFDIHADIDWPRGYEMLDKELQQLVRTAELGRRHVDKLVKVWRRDGQEAWVVIHVEVQSQAEEDFPQRMYVYNYRLYDKYNQAAVSLAVLADDRPDWRPRQFRPADRERGPLTSPAQAPQDGCQPRRAAAGLAVNILLTDH